MQSEIDYTTADLGGPEIWSPEFVAALVAEYGAQYAMGIAAHALDVVAGRASLDDAAFNGLAIVARLCLHLMGDDGASAEAATLPEAGTTLH